MAMRSSRWLTSSLLVLVTWMLWCCDCVVGQATDPFVGQLALTAFSFAPRGWALCNGQTLAINTNQALFALLGTTFGGNGVTTFNLPDLQGRAPIHQGTGSGLTPRVMGDIIGAESAQLTTSQLPPHNHGITDPGHSHTVNDPGHSHTINDPGHGHPITDSGHSHSVSDPGHTHTVTDPGHAHYYTSTTAIPPLLARDVDYYVNGTRPSSYFTNSTTTSTTGVGVATAHTGVTVQPASTGISIGHGPTGVSVATAKTSVTLGNSPTGVTTQATGLGFAFSIESPALVMNWIIALEGVFPSQN